MTGHRVPPPARRADRGTRLRRGPRGRRAVGRALPRPVRRAGRRGRRAGPARRARGRGRAARPRRRGPARRRRRPSRCPTAPTSSSPRRAGGRTSRCWPPPPRPASRCGATSSWPGGCGRTDAPWLGVTGTNGKTTTVQMLESILRAAGLRAVACGNVGLPVLDAVLADEPYDVLAVEVSSFQLHWTQTVRVPRRGDPQHRAGPHRLARLARGLRRGQGADLARRLVRRLQRRRPGGQPAWRRQQEDAQDFTLGPDRGALPRRAGRPAAGPLLRPRARRDAARVRGSGRRRRCRARRPRRRTSAGSAQRRQRARRGRAGPGPRPATASTASRSRRSPRGCAASRPAAHRIAHVATVDGVDYVDDSKATNPHAAAASLQAFDDVVWVAGGLAKGATFDDARRRRRGAAARRRADGPGPRAGRRRARATRARGPRRRGRRAPTLVRWTTSCAPPPGSPSPATPCCSRRPARRWTCSATTPRAATRSPRRSGGWPS